MMSDPISDMLTRIRNAVSARKSEVCVPYSTMKFAIAKILEREGFVSQTESFTEAKIPQLRIQLKYEATGSQIHDVRRVSRPGHRVYMKASELPRVLSNLGIAIVSTPNGLMTNKEARSRRLGGEIICEVY